MAFDGICLSAVIDECQALVGGSVQKITQTEQDAIFLTVKKEKETQHLYLSAAAQLPLLYLTDSRREAPLNAPPFCMLLRKHLQSGRISEITQPGLERVARITVLHRNELGDLTKRHLILEIMGKHSNIILLNENDEILDAIKRIPASVSSVREVLPGRSYFIPETQSKIELLTARDDEITARLKEVGGPLVKALQASFRGISKTTAEEWVYEGGLDARKTAEDLTSAEATALLACIQKNLQRIVGKQYAPVLYDENGKPKEFSVFPLQIFDALPARSFESPSTLVQTFYRERESDTRMHQKNADIRQILQSASDRCLRKIALQEKQLKDTEKRDELRRFGELLQAYGHRATPGAKNITVNDYNTGEDVTIPLDPQKTAQENAQHYFARYQKLKRTKEALTEQLAASHAEQAHLSSLMHALRISESEDDLQAIRKELAQFGYIKRAGTKKGQARTEKTKPLAFRSSDGFLLYVGKNNAQNEEVSFSLGKSGDLWFHVKGRPGSHVLVKTDGREIPDRLYEEAAALAAYYSDARADEKVEVDYLDQKELRKVKGAPPGFVIYHQNYSMVVTPSLNNLEKT